MPYSCFIDGCVQNSEEQGFFKPPKTKLEDWADKMPKKGLSKNSRLCWRHFDTHLVERGKMVGNVFVPQKKWRLVRGAEPTLKLDTIATMQPLSGSKRRQPLQLQNTNSEVLVKKKTFPSRLKPMNSIIGAPGYQTLMKPPSSKELNVNKENVGSILSKPVHSDIVVADTVEESESSSRLLDSNKLQHAVDENGLAYELIEPAGSQEEEGHLSEMDVPYEMDDWALENQRAFDYCQSTNGLSVEDVPPSTASSEPAVEETEDFQESLTDKEFSAGMHQEILSQSTTHQPNDCLDFPIDRPSTSVDVSTDALDSEPPFEQSTESLDCPIDELFFHELKDNVKLPSEEWHWLYTKKTNSAVCVNWSNAPDGDLIMKTIRVNSKMQVSFHIGGKTVSLPNSTGSYNTMGQLSTLFSSFDRMNPCRGILNPTLNNVHVTGKCSIVRDGNVWRSTGCSSLASPGSRNELCHKCSMALRYLRKRAAQPIKAHRSNRKLDIANQKVNRLQTREMAFSLALKKTQEKCRALLGKVRDESFDAVMKKLTDHDRKMVMMHVKRSAAKPGKNGFYCGVRYEAGFLLESLLLRMKSPKAYRHLRDNKILPLPSPKTLRKLLSSTDCHFGFNELALENIGKALPRSLKRHLRYGTLIWDEMSIRKDLKWDSKMLKWHGIVNFGSDIKEAARAGLADHVLVLVFRPFRAKWVQPIAWFASQGAANFKVLSEIILKGIIKLHKVGMIVKALVCDGHASNKAALNQMGVNGVKGKSKNFIIHPLDPTVKIYAFIDVPHLIKCTRNNVLNHKIVQYAGTTVYHKFYERLYDLEKSVHFKLCPKITYAHIWPTVWQKMNVSLATQLFSRHAALAMRILRQEEKKAADIYNEAAARTEVTDKCKQSAEKPTTLFIGSDATEKMTKLLNDNFDILNGRCPVESINEKNWLQDIRDDGSVKKGKKDILQDMLNVIDQTEDCDRNNPGNRSPVKSKKRTRPGLTTRTRSGPLRLPLPSMPTFASQTTLEGWRLSISSCIDLTEELLFPQDPEEKYAFVLSGKFNQDPIERLFGCVRSQDTHPTAASFLHIIRIMALYTPAKIILRNANVNNTDDLRVPGVPGQDCPIVTFKDCLVHKFRKNEEAAADFKDTLKDELLQELSIRFVTELPLTNEDRVMKMVIYDVCGYMMKTRGWHLECEDCKKSLLTTEDDLPADFDADEYTRTRTFGGLLFVSVPLFQTLCEVEKVVSAHFKSPSHIFLHESFQDCIAKVSLIGILPIFCDKHRDFGIPDLIMQYVTVRFYFESKRLSNLLLSKEKAKVQSGFKIAKTGHTQTDVVIAKNGNTK